MNSSDKIGPTLVLRRDRQFQCGGTSFQCFAGKLVWVTQEDEKTNKVLIRFGSGLQDWFHRSILDEFDRLPVHLSA